ncbi:type II toxin-antitoxin system toxin DNA ADP-ribosyl transferase DarT [Actinoplanes siamensis]|uniref:DarT domain-containing protein n=1 Tax=Actinoplanes siamensis TaxID=1223317 RepID=A0A919N7L4_9ACTN|nr:DUF4433 domain-containing protein [Actinoplanes siamensis]GIF05876.1 hypothetical protein Asi03nite_34140 [Actinoplanes siamensis]
MTQEEAGTSRNHWLYHFTHLDNLASITETRHLACDVEARSGLMGTEVGATDIKERRRRRAVPIAPGAHVGDYVPFYFAPRSPMLYRIACDHRDAIPDRYQGGDRPLVYLVTTTDAMLGATLDWVATDGNAATATTEFTSAPESLETLVDWPLMDAERWNNTQDDPDRQRRRLAEFLVHGPFPCR